MTTSKKLAISQMILLLISLISLIFSIIIIVRPIETGGVNLLFFGLLFFGLEGFLGIFSILIGIAILVLGIIQIVIRQTEKTSSVYLAAGICSICSFLPFVSIAALILNIIGLSKKHNLK